MEVRGGLRSLEWTFDQPWSTSRLAIVIVIVDPRSILASACSQSEDPDISLIVSYRGQEEGKGGSPRLEPRSPQRHLSGDLRSAWRGHRAMDEPMDVSIGQPEIFQYPEGWHLHTVVLYYYYYYYCCCCCCCCCWRCSCFLRLSGLSRSRRVWLEILDGTGMF